ncbi:coniferyl aldehyde dehydrogenase [Hyphomicrobium sp.]|uniref:coniferyl aldehyde dehydrogenase n=1 Tax=Hyphomicrobium sp. TaxID=82 RepID=UPI001DD27A3D|nr:coniferyl aldehyde dehydrogenase [Hyphomicrobium sp.]MBY0561017.1 coniferyl aldehyde dehydrogenase [Hyphomicrobium sp.]
MNAHVSSTDAFQSANRVSPSMDAILARQRAAFLRDGPPSLAARKADLAKLKKAIRNYLPEFQKTLHDDFKGRSANDTAILEGMAIVQGINYLRRNLRGWMRPQKRRVEMHFAPASARVTYQPLGVVGIMSPWNLPVGLSLMPLATAIAAGNRAMIKPSELTPATSNLLVRMLAEIFPAEQVAVVTGGPEVGAAFSSLPFDHIVFTGSTPVGKAVMKAASANLVPVTLELGGKSPVVIEGGFAPDRAAASLAFGKLANGGQLCVSPDYVLVQENDVEAFVAAYDKAVKARYPEGPASEDYTSVINERHFARLNALLDDARSNGARVIEVGAKPEGARRRPHTLAPTVVLGATVEMDVLNEEIFGPVLPVVAYRKIEDAIAHINAGPRPLALYYFGANGADRAKVLERTTSGNVTINDTILHFAQDDLPFGGVGASGIGAYHGIEGFRSLSHAKGIFEQSRWNMTGALRPPFGTLTRLVTWYLTR